MTWVSRAGAHDGGAIFDDRLLIALQSHFRISHVTVSATVPKATRLGSMLLHKLPHDRALYKAQHVIRSVRDASLGAGAVVISHESLDWLAAAIDHPVVLVLHNVTSGYASHIPPLRILSQFIVSRYRAYERAAYAFRPHRAVVTLSSADQRTLQKMTDLPVFKASPGMPPHTVLSKNALVRPRLAVSGTFDWILKVRGLKEFARAYHRARLRLAPVFDAVPPAFARDLIDDWRLGEMNTPDTLAFGLVTDRFEAGFKLKVGSYIANNLITISFANVGDDYIGLPHADEFIRPVETVQQMISIIESMSNAEPKGVIERFRVFQAAAARRFTWDQAGLGAAAAIRAAASSASDDDLGARWPNEVR